MQRRGGTRIAGRRRTSGPGAKARTASGHGTRPGWPGTPPPTATATPSKTREKSPQTYSASSSIDVFDTFAAVAAAVVAVVVVEATCV